MAENWWREVEQALDEALARRDTGRQSYLDHAGLAPKCGGVSNSPPNQIVMEDVQMMTKPGQ